MAILLDSGFFLAFCHPKDPNHQNASEIFLRMATGEFGLIFTTPYVISETATLMLVRTDNNHALLHDFHALFSGSEKFIRILPWKEELDEAIWTFFFQTNEKAKAKKDWLSFVDCSNIIIARENKIAHIAAYDGHFTPFLNNITFSS